MLAVVMSVTWHCIPTLSHESDYTSCNPSPAFSGKSSVSTPNICKAELTQISPIAYYQEPSCHLKTDPTPRGRFQVITSLRLTYTFTPRSLLMQQHCTVFRRFWNSRTMPLLMTRPQQATPHLNQTPQVRICLLLLTRPCPLTLSSSLMIFQNVRSTHNPPISANTTPMWSPMWTSDRNQKKSRSGQYWSDTSTIQISHALSRGA